MITRACISINNRCNLNCSYCHFHVPEKAGHLVEADMNVYTILDHIMHHINKYRIEVFKLGFVGNGEPLQDYDQLQSYIRYIDQYLVEGKIAAYTITNGTLVTEDMLQFFKAHSVNVGFSIDGIPEIHNKYRCRTHAKVMDAIELHRQIHGYYPSMNCTVGHDVLEHTEETIRFFEAFGSRITFSRMIGKDGITLQEFRIFLEKAKQKLNVRTGGYDCTMYGGLCGAGINNIFYANDHIYLCGNCVDLPTPYHSDTPLDEVCFNVRPFDRNRCYKEELQ